MWRATIDRIFLITKTTIQGKVPQELKKQYLNYFPEVMLLDGNCFALFLRLDNTRAGVTEVNVHCSVTIQLRMLIYISNESLESAIYIEY